MRCRSMCSVRFQTHHASVRLVHTQHSGDSMRCWAPLGALLPTFQHRAPSASVAGCTLECAPARPKNTSEKNSTRGGYLTAASSAVTVPTAKLPMLSCWKMRPMRSRPCAAYVEAGSGQAGGENVVCAVRRWLWIAVRFFMYFVCSPVHRTAAAYSWSQAAPHARFNSSPRTSCASGWSCWTAQRPAVPAQTAAARPASRCQPSRPHHQP